MKKIKMILPFIIIPVITPIYNILDSLFFVEIFGCGCVPHAQTNMFNIAFNANDLRRTVFFVLTIGMVFLSGYLSKAFKSRAMKVVYGTSVLIVNVILTMYICKTFMWA